MSSSPEASARTITASGTDRIPVRTLVGARGFDSSLTCLQSLVKFSITPVRLVVHEDGTLNEEHRDRLRSISPEASFIDRVEADRATAELLARHPRCAAFRRTEILALKLFDVSLLCPDRLAYSDSDILFLGPYSGIFDPRPNGHPVFMRDGGHAYAVRPWHLAPLGKLRLVGRLNTGLIITPPGYFDLDFIEWLLGQIDSTSVFSRRRYWTEQTCWAALAGRSACELFDPDQVPLATPTMDGATAGVAAVHFVSTYRNHLPTYAAKLRAPDAAPILVRTRSGRRVGPVAMFLSDAVRQFAFRAALRRRDGEQQRKKLR